MITCSTDLIAYQDGAISRGIAPCFAQLPVAELAAHMSRAEASLDESAFDFGFCEVVALLACASLAEAYPTMAQTGGDLGAPISISAQPWIFPHAAVFLKSCKGKVKETPML